MTPRRASSSATARGSWSTLSASRRASSATSSSSASRPGEPLGERLEPRVEPGQAARLLERDRGRVAGAGALLRQRLAERRRSPGDRLAVLGGRQAAADLVRLARPEVAPRDLGRLVLEQVEPAGHLARIQRGRVERGPVRAPALDRGGHRVRGAPRARRTRRAGRAASARRAAGPGRAGRGSRRAAPTSSASRAAVTAASSSRAVDRPLGRDLADRDERLRAAGRTAPRRAPSRPRGGRASCRRGRRAPARARR